MFNKRGISAIVATVLIILITVAAVTIIWVAIFPIIQDKFGFEDPGVRLSISTSGGYTFYDPETGYAFVQIRRGIDEAKIKGIHIVFNIAGESQIFVVNGSSIPELNGMTTVVLPVKGKPDFVSVFPILIKGGKLDVGISSSEIEMEENVAVDSIGPTDLTPSTDPDGNVIVDSSGEITLGRIMGLVAWFDSTEGVVRDSDNRVDVWEDQSGNGNHAYGNIDEDIFGVGLSRPLYEESVAEIGGLPALRFFDTSYVDDSEYNFTRLIIPSFTGGELESPATVFVVGIRDSKYPLGSLISAGRHFFDGVEASKRMFDLIHLGYDTLSLGSATNRSDIDYLVMVSGDHLYQWRINTDIFDRDNSFLRSYNKTEGMELYWQLDDSNLSGLTIGGKYNRTHGHKNDLDGQVAELMIFDRRLSDGEIGVVEDYLKTKYGFADSIASSGEPYCYDDPLCPAPGVYCNGNSPYLCKNGPGCFIVSITYPECSEGTSCVEGEYCVSD